jgi:hypothetical protein
VKTYKVGDDGTGKRLDGWLAAREKIGMSRSRLQALIEGGSILVDGQPA